VIPHQRAELPQRPHQEKRNLISCRFVGGDRTGSGIARGDCSDRGAQVQGREGKEAEFFRQSDWISAAEMDEWDGEYEDVGIHISADLHVSFMQGMFYTRETWVWGGSLCRTVQSLDLLGSHYSEVHLSGNIMITRMYRVGTTNFPSSVQSGQQHERSHSVKSRDRQITFSLHSTNPVFWRF